MIPRAASFAVLALVGVALPAAAQGPAGLSGRYTCWSANLSGMMAADAASAARSPGAQTVPDRIYERVSSGDLPLVLQFRPNGTYTNLTFGERYASDPKWQGRYTRAGGRVKLVTSQGSLLHTFRPARGNDGAALLVEEIADPAKSYLGQVCRRTDGNAQAPASSGNTRSGQPGASTARSAGSPRRDPFNPHSTDRSWPGWFVSVADFSHPYEVQYPRETVVKITFAPAAGGTPLVFTRTVGALRTPAAPDERRPLEETYILPDIRYGTYRVSATATLPDGTERRLLVQAGSYGKSAEEVEWTLAAEDRVAFMPTSLFLRHPE